MRNFVLEKFSIGTSYHSKIVLLHVSVRKFVRKQNLLCIFSIQNLSQTDFIN